MSYTLKDFRQQILDLNDENRVLIAKDQFETLSRGVGQEDAFKLMRMITQVFVSADRKCTREEYDLYTQTTGDKLTCDQFFEVTNGGSNPELIKGLVEFCQKIDKKYRYAIAIFGCCLMAHDGTLTVEEQNIFEKVLGY